MDSGKIANVVVEDSPTIVLHAQPQHGVGFVTNASGVDDGTWVDESGSVGRADLKTFFKFYAILGFLPCSRPS